MTHPHSTCTVLLVALACPALASAQSELVRRAEDLRSAPVEWSQDRHDVLRDNVSRYVRYGLHDRARMALRKLDEHLAPTRQRSAFFADALAAIRTSEGDESSALLEITLDLVEREPVAALKSFMSARLAPFRPATPVQLPFDTDDLKREGLQITLYASSDDSGTNEIESTWLPALHMAVPDLEEVPSMGPYFESDYRGNLALGGSGRTRVTVTIVDTAFEGARLSARRLEQVAGPHYVIWAYHSGIGSYLYDVFQERSSKSDVVFQFSGCQSVNYTPLVAAAWPEVQVIYTRDASIAPNAARIFGHVMDAIARGLPWDAVWGTSDRVMNPSWVSSDPVYPGDQSVFGFTDLDGDGLTDDEDERFDVGLVQVEEEHTYPLWGPKSVALPADRLDARDLHWMTYSLDALFSYNPVAKGLAGNYRLSGWFDADSPADVLRVGAEGPDGRTNLLVASNLAGLGAGTSLTGWRTRS